MNRTTLPRISMKVCKALSVIWVGRSSMMENAEMLVWKITFSAA